MDELRVTGAKTEYIGGRFVAGAAERRFSDHDYRLLVEHGAIPEDTILVAGIVFWKHACSKATVNANRRSVVVPNCSLVSGIEHSSRCDSEPRRQSVRRCFFDHALVAEGLAPRHSVHARNVPMYRTRIPLAPAGRLCGTMVVSMRP